MAQLCRRKFRRELMAFPASKYDDQVDALSQALDRAFSRRGRITTEFVAGYYQAAAGVDDP